MKILRTHKKVVFLFFALLLTANVFAQLELKLEVSSRSIGKDEVLQVSYSVQNAGEINSRLSVSGFPGWKVVSGPQTSQETSIVNGTRTSSIGFIYLLMPQKTGTLSIPGASIVADGKQLTCSGTSVHVSNQSSGAGSMPSGNPSAGGMAGLQALLDRMAGADEQPETGNVLHRGETAEQKIKDNMFVRATPSKKAVYVGEPFIVTYQLFSALGGQSKVSGQPTFQGVGVVDLTKESEPEIVTVGTKRYRAFLIRKVQLTALQPGKVSLGVVETSNEIPFTSYDDPYNPQTYTQLIRNPEIFVDAKPLPDAGKPADFSGAIGNFRIRVAPQKTTIPAGENNTLRIEITGTGNLQAVALPQVAWPAGIEHYDPKDSQNVDKRSVPIRVSKVFEIPFIGGKEGNATFAPIVFSYFDTETGTYKTIQSDPFTVTFTAPLTTKSNDDNSFGVNVKNVAMAIGGVVVLILLITLIAKVSKKSKTQPQPSKKDILEEKKDESAPWNVEEKKNDMDQKTESITVAPSNMGVPKEMPQEEEKPKKNFNIELQKILLSTDKSDMYAKGATLVQEILSNYLNVPIQSKDQLLTLLNSSNKPDIEKENILKSVQNLQEHINKGLYSPFFSEADRLNLMDGLNDLLRRTGM